MPELDHHPEDESHYDCEFCRDTGKLDGSEYYDCGHCHVAAERVQLERMVRALGGMSIEDIAYKVQQTAKRTAYAVAAAEMVLLRDKAAQAERRAFELSEKLAKAEQDAARWRQFTEGPYPICFLGFDHATKASLDAAVDASMSEEPIAVEGKAE
jgi:hypothetical protein